MKCVLLTLEHVLDSSADLVVIHKGDLIDRVLADPEALFANNLDGSTVTERTDFAQDHSLASRDTPLHRITVDSLDSDNLDAFGSDPLDVGRHSGDQSATSNAAKDPIQLLKLLHLAGQLDRYSALTGNDERVVVGRDEVESVNLSEPGAFGFGLVKVLSMQNNLGAEPLDISPLDGGCRQRHDDRGRNLQAGSSESHSLSVVAYVVVVIRSARRSDE